jgi:DNA-directed RNA polymerase specialized sigma24 family protein
MSRRGIRQTVHRALVRITDPLLLEIAACWNRLSPEQQRLVYLHRVLGIPLRQVARDGLLRHKQRDGRSAEFPCPATLRKQMREIERKVRRLHKQEMPPG